MPITPDITAFERLNVVDSCSLWNLLASDTLRNAAIQVGCTFCITQYVEYECLLKPRKKLDAAQIELMRRLTIALTTKIINAYFISLEDLLEVEVLESRHQLGRGELTTIIFAKTTKQAVVSDDKQARKLATQMLGPAAAQSVPHLLGWLVYVESLSEHQWRQIETELATLNRNLAPHLENANLCALQAKLMERSISSAN